MKLGNLSLHFNMKRTLKGRLHKTTNQGWIVLFDDESLPLNAYQQTSDLLSGSEVEFEIETFYETGVGPLLVATIIAPFVSDDFQIGPDGAYEHGVDEEESSSWDEIHEEYSQEEYPPFGGPFTNALTPWEWLKKYYEPPQRRKN